MRVGFFGRIGCSLVLLTAVVQGSTIVSVTGPADVQDAILAHNVAAGLNAVASSGWTQTSTYTGVTISATVQMVFAGTIEAYLTTQIGPGTTVANQLNFSSIVLPVGAPGPVTLFSGLTLGPGTYFLTLDTPDSPTDWWTGTDAATITTAAGVTHLSDTAGSPVFGIYTPSHVTNSVGSFPLLYTVTGNLQSAVPEPTTFGLLAIGALFFGLVRRSVG